MSFTIQGWFVPHLLFLNQKAYFPALHPGTHAADGHRPHAEDEEQCTISRSYGLVYLTWTTLFFSDGIQNQRIGAPCLPSAEAEPAEVSPRTCGDQTVLIDFSLYDVNALHFRRKCQHQSDWTDKNHIGAYRSNRSKCSGGSRRT